MIVKIADIIIKINSSHPYVPSICKKYEIKKYDHIDFEVDITDEDYKNVRKHEEYKDYPDWYIEGGVVYRKICHQLYKYNAIMIHGTAILYNNKVYMLSAPSGTGKSTHANLIIEASKNKAIIINGDKPIIRLKDGKYYAYGTPWCGKEYEGTCQFAEVAAICFLERGEPRIEGMSPKEVTKSIITEIVYPASEEEAAGLFRILNEVIMQCKLYKVYCDLSKESGKLSFEKILKAQE